MATRSNKTLIFAGVVALMGGIAAAAFATTTDKAVLYGAGTFIVLFVGIMIGVGVAQGVREGAREAGRRKDKR